MTNKQMYEKLIEKGIDHPTPGEIFKEEYLDELECSPELFSAKTGISIQLLKDLWMGEQKFTIDIDGKISKELGMPSGLFMQLQADFESTYHHHCVDEAVSQ